jgi:hypothetical protein
MHASTPLILRKSRMRRRARTDLCGGRSVMVVPTATVKLFGPVCFGTESLITRYAPRITRNSGRPRASDRTMVDTQTPSFACQVSRLDWRWHHQKMKPAGMATSQQNLSSNRGHNYRQWAGSRDKNLLALRSGQRFFLDIPFYRTQNPRSWGKRLWTIGALRSCGRASANLIPSQKPKN